MESILEQLYMSPEMEEVYERGRRKGLKQHICPKVKERVVFRMSKREKEYKEGRWGVINNGLLLNPRFKSEAEAAIWIREGLVPANPEKRLTTKIDAIVIKL